jgi:hypothetical protein
MKDRQKRLKQKLFQTKGAIKRILSKELYAQGNSGYLGLPVLSKHTS